MNNIETDRFLSGSRVIVCPVLNITPKKIDGLEIVFVDHDGGGYAQDRP